MWRWLAKAENRSVVAFIGGGLAAVIAAGWTVFVYLHPKPEPVPAAAQAPVPVPETAAAERYARSVNAAYVAAGAGLDRVTNEIDRANNAGASPRR
jgi:hypothetical protein